MPMLEEFVQIHQYAPIAKIFYGMFDTVRGTYRAYHTNKELQYVISIKCHS
jgi:hypothetical protein